MIKKQSMVSVVIPNHNYANYLETCIDSILGQTYSKLEVIVVDDGSTDASIERLERYGNSITLIKTPNQGVNRARNIGLSYCNGDYVAFCDSDDVWHREKIEKQVSIIESCLDCVLIYSSIQYINARGEALFVENAEARGDISQDYIRYPTKSLVLAGSSTALMRRSAILKTGSFDSQLEGNLEDWDFFRRISQLGKIDYVEKPLVQIRKHEVSRSFVDLQGFYGGARKAILKAMMDPAHKWTPTKKFLFNFRFEITIVKSALKKWSLIQAFRHLLNAISFR